MKVWDVYRPLSVQKLFCDILKDVRFVANLETGGSIHNHKCAVDVTIVNKNGNELDEDIRKNLTVLHNTMTKWHS